TDRHGNTGSASFNVTVTVVDTTPPVLTLPSDITTTSGSNAGTVVTYSASATDNTDGSITPSCTPASGSSFPVGTTTVTCTATDAHSNTAQKTFAVTIVLVDATPPSLTGVPPNSRREADGPAGSIVNYVPPTAIDDVDGPVPVACAPAFGKTFPLG